MTGQGGLLGVLVVTVVLAATLLPLPSSASLTVGVKSDTGHVDLLHMEESSQVTMNYSYDEPAFSPPVLLKFVTAKVANADVTGNNTALLHAGSQGEIPLTLYGGKIGRTTLTVLVNDSSVVNGSQVETDQEGRIWFVKVVFPLVISRRERVIDTVFNVGIIIIVIIANLSMGCHIDLDVIKTTMKRPIAPAIGFVSQFIIMPLVTFTLAYLLKFEPGVALGFLTMGSCPGGSGSNFWTFMLGGDVSLSVTMTVISTIGAFAMLPLWIFTLGTQVLYKGHGLTIPFANIFTSLLALVLPAATGFLVKWKKPGWAKYLEKLLKPTVVVFILFLLTVGVYANIYIFGLIRPLILVAGALSPYLGFILGGLVALATRRKKSHVITIAIETGIQNTGIAIVLLRFSLHPPESDIAVVSPVAAALFTPLPIIVAVIAVHVRRRFCLKNHVVKDRDPPIEPQALPMNEKSSMEDCTNEDVEKKQLEAIA